MLSTPQAQINMATDVSDNLLSTGITGGAPRGLWSKALGGTMHQGSTSGYNYGILTGYGYSLGAQKRDIIGGAFSYMHSEIGQDSSHYNAINDYGLWLYGLYYPTSNRNYKLTGTVGGGLSSGHMYSTTLGLPITGNLNGDWFSTAIRGSYWAHVDSFIVSPRLSLSYNYNSINAYNTQGVSFLNVNVGAQTGSEFTVSPAILIGHKYKLDHVRLLPQVRLGMNENVGPSSSAVITAGQATAVADGLTTPHTQGTAELRLDIGHGTDAGDVRGWAGNVAVKQVFGGGESQTEGVATLKYNW